MRNYANNVPATTLNGAVNSTVTAWTVANGTGYPAVPFTAKCESEIVLVTAKSGTNDVNWTVERGFDGSTAASHATSTAVTDAVIAADFDELWAGRGFSGAELRRTATQSIANTTWDAIEWQAAEYDNGAFWSPTNNTRITFSEAGKYLVVANPIFVSNSTGARFARIIRNGNQAKELALSNIDANGVASDRWEVSAVVDAAASDYVEVEVYQDSTAALNLDGTGSVGDDAETTRCWVYRISSMDGTSFSGARVYRSTNQTGLVTATVTEVEWNAETFDTDNYHDNTTNNTRLTVPADGKYLVTATLMYTANATGQRQARIHVNGSEVATNAYPTHQATYTPGVNISSVLDLSANDYVEIAGYQDSGGNLDLITNSGNTLFATITRLHSSGAVKIDDLTDVDTTTTAPTAGSLLRYDGSDWVPWPTKGTYDDWFDDGTLDTDWTTLTVTGSQTITESAREQVLSVAFEDQAAGDFNALLKSGGTIATGTKIITGVKTVLRANYDLVGICFSDGVTSSSNLFAAVVYSNASRLTTWDGTFTGATERLAGVWNYGPAGAGDWLYLRLTYVSANTWTAEIGDGVSWTAYDSSRSFTMTPTHFGLCWSSSGGTSINIGSFKYFVVE